MGVAEGEGTEKFLMEQTKHIPSEFKPTVVTALLSTALTTLSTQLNSRLVTALLSTALTTLSAQLSTQLKDWSPPSLSPALTIGFRGVSIAVNREQPS